MNTFDDQLFILKVGYPKWEPEEIKRLPEGKLPRKLKKRLKNELDNPDRKKYYKCTI